MKPNSLRPALLLAVALCAGESGAQGQGPGGGRQRAHNADCGSDLVVVMPDGQRRNYDAAEQFFGSFETIVIDQGEHERAAVPLDAVLRAHDADWVEGLNCDNRSLQLPTGLPFEGRDLLVLTGKRNLKAVKEVQPGRYRNTLEQIRKLTFRKISAEPKRESEAAP